MRTWSDSLSLQSKKDEDEVLRCVFNLLYYKLIILFRFNNKIIIEIHFKGFIKLQ
jgi:hypothetical protein